MEKNINIILKNNKCTGCSACVHSCPKQAISFTLNSYGFFTPTINNERCVNCGLCITKCPAINHPQAKNIAEARYGWSSNKSNRIESTSGGMFSEIVDSFLDKCGYVCGCVISNNQVFHDIKRLEEKSAFLGSKYVQSDLKEVFHQIKDLLLANNKIVFSGTPCQVYGLLSFIPDELKNNLLTIDFVCHGVPSQKLFHDHCKYNGYKVLSFRSKDRRGWERSEIKVIKNNKIKYLRQWKDKFIFMFNNNNNNNLNPACCECPFINNHFSDITLADFWQYSHFDISQTDLYNGISLIKINTSKGKDALLRVNCILEEIDNLSILKEREHKYSKQSSLNFYDDYLNYGYRKAIKKHAKNGYVHMLFKKIFKK